LSHSFAGLQCTACIWMFTAELQFTLLRLQFTVLLLFFFAIVLCSIDYQVWYIVSFECEIGSRNYICVTMSHVQYVDELIREYLLYRGFSGTLKAFDSELKVDKDKSFRVSKQVISSTIMTKNSHSFRYNFTIHWSGRLGNLEWFLLGLIKHTLSDRWDWFRLGLVNKTKTEKRVYIVTVC
jgi:hypothetical protein